MIRRELIGMVAALALSMFSGFKAGNEPANSKPRAEVSCACCGSACDCSVCTCDDRSATRTTGCDCCGGASCCSAQAKHQG